MESGASLIFVLLIFIHFSLALPQLRLLAPSNVTAGRSLQATSQCRSVALRLLPPPALTNYTKCFREKMGIDSTHNWSIPGAEIDAQLQCWCEYDVTKTMEEYGCCEHDDIYPMCSVNCDAPDCNSPLALECVNSCPAMCLEAAEYVVDTNLCKDCDWIKCWPIMSCLVDHAKARAEDGDLASTCHEPQFHARPELAAYQECWAYAPKHTSHWNVLSSIVNCICRENMKEATRSTDCCASVRYGAGICDLTCVEESECASQVAQTCVHDCQLKCPALEQAPSTECIQKCLSMGAPCRKYVSCSPSSAANFVCDDGRWPQANSGCCIDRDSGRVGCPLACESERIWRLDRTLGAPEWAREYNGAGVVAMCACTGCPATVVDGVNKLKSVVEDDIWQNGQMMLIDIARRENLKYGPNRNMQTLMALRNELILTLMREAGDEKNLDRRIAEINLKYTEMITIAARMYGDDDPQKKTEKKEKHTKLIVVVVSCSILVLGGLGVCAICKRNAPGSTPVHGFQQGEDVVVGHPVRDEEHQEDPFSNDDEPLAPFSGTPVTTTAATKPIE